MARIPDKQIATAVIGAGFPTKDQATAVAIALAESGGNPAATNRNSNGSTDYGLFQINSIHAAILRSGSWSNPNDNARMAKQVYADAGNSFRPWVAYTSGSYLAFVGRGRTAVGVAPDWGELQKWGDTKPGLGAFVSIYTDTDLWVRVGMFVAGGMLIIWGLLMLTSVDNTLGKVALFGATKGKVKL